MNRFYVRCFPIATLFLLVVLLPDSPAQTIWSETFNDENLANSNWPDAGVNAGLASWSWTNDPSAGYQDPDLPVFAAPTASDGYFYFDSDNNGQTPHDVWITGVGNPANCTGKIDVRLRFFTQYIYFNPAGTVAQVGVSTNGVDFEYKDLFTGLQANLPYHDWVEVDLDEADNQPQVWLRFRWIGNYEYHWKIDDLQLAESCAPGQAGNFTLPPNGILCFGEQLQEQMTIDSASFVLSTDGPQAGLAWCITAGPIPANTWPGTIPGAFSTPFSTEIYRPFLVNDAGSLPHGSYFLTPVVLGGGQLLDTAGLAVVSNIDPSGGCWMLGQSQQLVLLPEVDPLSITAAVTNEQVPPGDNGAIALTFGGGSGAFLNNPAQYEFLWSNGANTPDLANLPAGNYTVTVSDASGCTAEAVETFIVEQTVSSPDKSLVQQLSLRPNPSTGLVQFDLQLGRVADLRYDLRNLFGQPVAVIDAGPVVEWHRSIDLRQFPEGIYVLNLQLGAEQLQRLILIQRR